MNSIYTCDKGVDGNYDGNMNDGFCYHSSEFLNNKWWIVVLDSVSNISLIRIFSRTDCCSIRTNSITFYASYNIQTTFVNDPSVFYKVQYYQGPPPFGVISNDLPTSRLIARTIAMTKPYGTDPINICEVEVWGYPYVKNNPINFRNVGSYPLYATASPYQTIIARSRVECAKICKESKLCVSFTMQTGSPCLLYSHGGGNMLP